jgi:hypothetical protein
LHAPQCLLSFSWELRLSSFFNFAADRASAHGNTAMTVIGCIPFILADVPKPPQQAARADWKPAS